MFQLTKAAHCIGAMGAAAGATEATVQSGAREELQVSGLTTLFPSVECTEAGNTSFNQLEGSRALSTAKPAERQKS